MNTQTTSSTSVRDEEGSVVNDETSQDELEEDEESDSGQISKSSVSHIKQNNKEVMSTSHDSESRIQTSQQLGEETSKNLDSKEHQEENSKDPDSVELQEENSKNLYSEELQEENSKNSYSEELREENSKSSDFEEAKEYHQTDRIPHDTSAQKTQRNDIHQDKSPENNVQNNKSQTPKNDLKQLKKLPVAEKQSIESEVLKPTLNSSEPLSSNEIVSLSAGPKLSVSEEALMPMISQIIKRELQNVQGTTARHHLERTLAHFEQKSKITTTPGQVENGEIEAQVAAKTNVDVVTTSVTIPSEGIAKPQVKNNSPNEETNLLAKDVDRDGLRKHIPRPPKESVCFSPVENYISDDNETISKSTFSKDIKATSSPAQNQMQNSKFYR